MTDNSPATDFRCPECQCRSFARVQDGAGHPTDRIRCMNCKQVFPDALAIRAETAKNSGEVERLGVLRTGFCTTEVYGPEKYYALKIKFPSLNALHKAHDELIAALATPANSRAEAIRECIAIVERPAEASNSLEWKFDYVLPALRALLQQEGE